MASATDGFLGVLGDPLSANWTVFNGSFSLVGGNNGVTSTAGTGGDSVAFYSALTFTADHGSYALLSRSANIASSVVIRLEGAPGSQSYYGVQVYDTATFELFKYVGGVYTTIHSFTEPWTNLNGVNLYAIGTSITVQMNSGSGYATIGGGAFTDGSNTAGTKLGIRIYSTATLDDWGGGDVVAGASAIMGGTGGTVTEAEVVTGGKTITLTLSGDTWITN